jgi:hypothetical protein
VKCEACGKSLEAHRVEVYGLRGGEPMAWTPRIFDGKARRVEVRCQHPAVLLRHARAAWSRFAASLAALDLDDPERITQAAHQWAAEHGAVPTDVELFAQVVRHGYERIGNLLIRNYYGPRSPIGFVPTWDAADVLDLLAAILGPLVEVEADPESIAA